MNLTWNTRHKDPKNSDYFPVNGPSEFRVKKKLLRQIPVATFVAVDSSKRMYAYSLNEANATTGNLWAFDAEGNELWHSSEVSPSLSSIGVTDEGMVYVADGTSLVQISCDGKLLQKTALPEETSAVMFLSEHELVILGIKGHLYYYDSRNNSMSEPYFIGCKILDRGVQHSHMPTNPKHLDIFTEGVKATNASPSYASQVAKRILGIGVGAKNVPAIDQAQKSVFIIAADQDGTGSNAIRLDWIAKDGQFKKIFETPIGAGCDTSPNLSHDGKRIYCVDKEGFLYSISATDGAVLWKYQMEDSSSASVNSTPDNHIYISIKRDIVCLEDTGSAGKLAWSTNMISQAKKLGFGICMINSVNCVVENNVYAVAAYGKKIGNQFIPFKHQLIVIDRATGALVSTLPIAHESLCTPSMLDANTLIVPSKPFYQGILKILRKKSLLHKFIFPKPVDFHGLTLYENKENA